MPLVPNRNGQIGENPNLGRFAARDDGENSDGGGVSLTLVVGVSIIGVCVAVLVVGIIYRQIKRRRRSSRRSQSTLTRPALYVHSTYSLTYMRKSLISIDSALTILRPTMRCRRAHGVLIPFKCVRTETHAQIPSQRLSLRAPFLLRNWWISTS